MIKHAAIRQDNIVYVGRKHADCMRYMIECGLDAIKPEHEQGFITSDGCFVDRVEAFRIAIENNQIVHKYGPAGVLYSEDLFERDTP